MDMDLVPRYADEAQAASGVAISTQQQQNTGMKTANVEMRQLVSPFSAFATVATDERNVSVVSAPANGVVSKLFVNAPQQQVKAGGRWRNCGSRSGPPPSRSISRFVSLAMPH